MMGDGWEGKGWIPIFSLFVSVSRRSVLELTFPSSPFHSVDRDSAFCHSRIDVLVAAITRFLLHNAHARSSRDERVFLG